PQVRARNNQGNNMALVMTPPNLIATRFEMVAEKYADHVAIRTAHGDLIPYKLYRHALCESRHDRHTSQRPFQIGSQSD
ncbi:MAG: hypothetical protein ACKN81_09205, partial [Pirellulaceae bacterium]